MADAPTKEVVTKAEALVTKPTPPPKKPVFRFVKNHNPGEPVIVNGVPLAFHRPVQHDGLKASFAEFNTHDADLAAQLREVIKAKPGLYVFEKEIK